MGGQLHDISDVLTVTSSTHEYRILMNSLIRDFTFPIDSIVISDSRFQDNLKDVPNNKIFIDAVEENKSLETCIKVLGQIQEFGGSKSTQIISVGGGIIQDISTLVASLYMRGIDWIYFPTTKMSQLDSCIGGKSSINLLGKKNLVGNIYPPKEIHIDSSFDTTLSNSALVSGYLEAVKISFAHSSSGFHEHLRIVQNYRDLNQIPQLKLNSLVLKQKKYFVENDEFDKGIRQNLNFGHTFGHAIESASTYSIPHGIAIGIGILIANRHPLAAKNENISILNDVVWNLLKKADPSFVEVMSKLDSEVFIKSFMSDKKHSNGNYSIIIAGEHGLEKVTQVWNTESKDLITGLLNEVRMEISNEI